MNFILVMRNEQAGLVAVGPMAIEYQAAMLRDGLEQNPGWSTVGIARVMTPEQAGLVTPGQPGGGGLTDVPPPLGGGGLTDVPPPAT